MKRLLLLLLLACCCYTPAATAAPLALLPACMLSTAPDHWPPRVKVASAGPLQKIAAKLLHRREREGVGRQQTEATLFKKAASVISLVAGAAGLVLMFTGLGAGFLLLIVLSIITGIIGAVNNPSSKHRKMARLGLILSAATLAVLTVLVLAFAGVFD